MHAKVIQAMKDKGWNLHLIAKRSGINQSRLERGVLGTREERALYRLAEEECGLDIDEIEQE
ncbi:hypothetical protein D3C77_660030 [compost metagenome]